MYILAPKFKKCANQPLNFLNMQTDSFINFFLSIFNKNITHSRMFKISSCIFRKIQGVDLYMIQRSGEYNTLILTKIYIRESSGGRFVHF